MKERIVLFIIGVLVGAIISTGAFYIYSITSKTCDSSSATTQMNNGMEPPQMPNGENGGNMEPPEKPDGEQQEPPEKPNNTEENNQKSE